MIEFFLKIFFGGGGNEMGRWTVHLECEQKIDRLLDFVVFIVLVA